MTNPETTAPWLHDDLMEVPTHKLVNELLHRVRVEEKQFETNPHAFADLSLLWRVSHG